MDIQIRFYVTAAAEDGKANKAVINLLSKALGTSKSSIEIVRGKLRAQKQSNYYKEVILTAYIT
jgi:uncharacterized protein YggU (UPF0235/DUF167 family)